MPSEPIHEINIRCAIPGYATLTQSAVILDVSQPTVRRYVRQGKLTPHKIGGRQVLIAVEDLERLLTERGRHDVA